MGLGLQSLSWTALVLLLKRPLDLRIAIDKSQRICYYIYKFNNAYFRSGKPIVEKTPDHLSETL
jgi:hypothetical protein